MADWKPAPDGSKRLAWVRPVALAALLCVAPMVSARQKEVQARWEELAPLVEKREIETVLANGVHIRGRVETVLPDVLVVQVKRTSDPNLAPKGRTRVSRELVSQLTVRWKRRLARILLPVAFLYGGGFGWMWVSGALLHREVTEAEGYVVPLVLVIAGYWIGDVLDERRLAVRILPAPPPPISSVDTQPKGEHEQ